MIARLATNISANYYCLTAFSVIQMNVKYLKIKLLFFLIYCVSLRSLVAYHENDKATSQELNLKEPDSREQNKRNIVDYALFK